MSKATYWQRGESIDFLNETAHLIEANTVVVLGERIGIAGTDIPAHEKGSLHVTGVYKFPKAGATDIKPGDVVYWDNSAGNITKTVGSNKVAGFAVEAAATEAATVTVKINA